MILLGHENMVATASFSQDNKRVVTSGDMTVRDGMSRAGMR